MSVLAGSRSLVRGDRSQRSNLDDIGAHRRTFSRQPLRCHAGKARSTRSRVKVVASSLWQGPLSFPQRPGSMLRALFAGFDKAKGLRAGPQKVINNHQETAIDVSNLPAGTSAVVEEVALEEIDVYKPDGSTTAVVPEESSPALDVYIPQGSNFSNSVDGPQSRISVSMGHRRGFELLEPNATPTKAPKTLSPPLSSPEEPERQQQPASSLADVGLKDVLWFCIPAMGALLADPLMSLVDTVCVGQLSTLDLAALGPNTAIFAFINQVFSFFTTATTGMVAFRVSRGQYADAGKMVSNALLCALVLGVTTTVLMFGYGRSILSMFATNSELMGPALMYLCIRAVSVPALLVSTVCTAACLGQRDPTTPLRVAGFAGLFNVVFDVYLVLGPPRWGIVGAAVATTAAQYLGAAVYLSTLWNRVKCPLQLRIPTLAELKPFFSASTVLMVRSLCLTASVSLMTYSATSLGNLVIAGHQVAVSAFTITQFVPEPISQCGQSLLARRPGFTPEPRERAAQARVARLLLKCAATCGVAMAALMAVPAALPHWWTPDAAVQAAVRSVGPRLATAAALLSVVCVSDGLLLAAGDYTFCAGMHILNLSLVTCAFLFLPPTGLPGIWAVMVFFQGGRVLQNFARLRAKGTLNRTLHGAAEHKGGGGSR